MVRGFGVDMVVGTSRAEVTLGTSWSKSLIVQQRLRTREKKEFPQGHMTGPRQSQKGGQQWTPDPVCLPLSHPYSEKETEAGGGVRLWESGVGPSHPPLDWPLPGGLLATWASSLSPFICKMEMIIIPVPRGG